MNNDEFVKYIKKYGDIRPVQEAFEKYPVEEEEHKGKIESYLHVAEETEGYNNLYKIGDIVYVKKFIYEDGRRGTNHLFVIIGENNLAVSIEYFGMLISSKIYKQKYKENKLLIKDKENKLNVDSIVKTDIVYRIEIAEIICKIGQVDNERIQEYKESHYEILKEKRKKNNELF